MKFLYCSSLSYPASNASGVQTLSTAEALGHVLGNDFILCASAVRPNDLYAHARKEFGHAQGFVLAWRQLRYARAEGVSVIFCREPALMAYLLFLNRHLFRLPIRFLFEAHGLESVHTRYAYAVRHADHVFALTSLLASDISERFGTARVTILPDGVDPTLFARASQAPQISGLSDIPLVAYIGSVGTHDWKGLDTFIAARQFVPLDAALFVIAGVKSGADAYQARYPSGFAFLPWLAREDAAGLMKRSSVLVLPNTAKNVTSQRHTSPMKLFEYMASGTPIVASDLPSIRDVLDDACGVLVVPDDSHALAEGVCRLLRDSAEARTLAARARERVAQYTWSKRAEKILSVVA